jgi:hypothetical protein
VPRQIDFPTKPFYIISRLDNSRWVLTLTPPYPFAVAMRHLTNSTDQLWAATPDPRGGAFLTHVATQFVLAYRVAHDPKTGEAIVLTAPLFADLGGRPPNQLWRCEDLGGGTVGINAFLNWECKINIYHSDPNGTVGLYKWDGGAPNESWVFGQLS